eukprot:378525_1
MTTELVSVSQTEENSISQTVDSALSKSRQDLFQDTAPTGDPSKWDWTEVQRWLTFKDLKSIKDLINGEESFEDGIYGEEFIHLDLNQEKWITKHHKDFKKFQKALQKLRLKNTGILDMNDHDTSVHDFIEMNRRINFFIEKWDRILWIEHYFDTNSRLPTEEDICHA